MFHQRCLLFISFMLISFSLFAQSGLPGYIITLKGDTLKGAIVDAGHYKNNRSVSFKAGGQTTAKVYQPSELKGYVIDHKEYYLTKDIKSEGKPVQPFFVREIVRGTNSLFLLVNENRETTFILEKHTGEILPLRSKYLDGMLKNYLADCSTLDIKPGKYKYTISSLTQLLSQYNACQSPATKVAVLTPPEKLFTTFGARVGVSSTQFYYDTDGSRYYQQPFNPGLGYSLGGFVSMVYNDRFYLNVEVNYSSRAGSLSEDASLNEDLKLRINYLHIPLLVRYDLLKTSIRPYVLTGVGTMLFMYTDAQSIHGDLDFRRRPGVPYNLMAGSGLSVKLKSGSRINVEFRYDYAKSNSKAFTAYPSRQTAWELSTSYTF